MYLLMTQNFIQPFSEVLKFFLARAAQAGAETLHRERSNLAEF